MKEIKKYSHCFVCGDQNKIGLRARFYFDGRIASTKIKAGDLYEGYKGIFHGGILSTLLDEVMIKAILADDQFAVTAEITVRFHAPVRTGDELLFEGWVTSQKGRMFLTEGKVSVLGGRIVGSATGKYIKAKPELKTELMQSID